MKLVFLGVYGFIVCMVVLALIVVRGKKFIPGSAMDEAQSKDFFNVIGDFKRRSLEKQPWNMQYEVYKTIATVCSIIFAVLAYITSANLFYTVVAAAAGMLIPEFIVHFQSSKQRSGL